MEYQLQGLTQQELQVLYMGLGELPLKVGVNLLHKIQQQVHQQDTAAAVSLEDMGFSEIQPPIN